VKTRKKSAELVQANLAEFGRELPDFLHRVDGAEPEGHILRVPEAADASLPVQTQLIVEFCSK
jgi:ribosomal protein S4